MDHKPTEHFEKESEDHSILCRPIQLGLTGTRHIVHSVQHGTPEVRNLLINECDLIYECKVCKSLHRSLANFIAHKRVYCTEHCCHSMRLFSSQDVPEDVVVVQPESPPGGVPTAESLRDQLTTCTDPTSSAEPSESVGASLPTKMCAKMTTEPKEAAKKRSSPETSLPNQQRVIATSSPAPKKSGEGKESLVVHLKNIAQNKNAVFQVVIKQEKDDPPEVSVKSEVITVIPTAPGSKRSRPSSATNAGKSKRISGAGDDTDSLGSKEQFSCCKCGIKFTSLKTLTFHLKSIHAKHRVYFPCLYCKSVFSQTWGVVRHLLTVHHKSREQVEKLRDKIRRRAMQRARRDQASSAEEEEEEIDVGGESADSIKDGVGDVVEEKSNGAEVDSDVDNDSVIQVAEVVKPDADAEVVELESVSAKSCGRCDAAFEEDAAYDAHLKICRVQRKVTGGKRPSAQVSAATAIPNGDGRPRRIVKRKINKDFVTSDKIEDNETVGEGGDGNESSLSNLALRMASIIDTEKRCCLECGAKFSRLSNLRRHAASHTGFNRYKCKFCNYLTYVRAQCLVHIRRNHPIRGKSRLQPDKLVVDLLADDPSLANGDIAAGATKRSSTSPSAPSGPRSRQRDANKGGELNKAIAAASFRSILQRRDSQPSSKFNISTRMSPRTFDTSPYCPSSQPSSLKTRYGGTLR